ncbi:ankyrin repeat-containing domain protein [Lasiosphaeris hirsuta]|uniref:Ankyrin repeat-containing domain protein n=1 Tax=Lasiosphaeris hirsuta TaxID=260670 RepID=A0AA40AA85_9PEZI|nr:ankyrin repeat-containing domain protein [Lasiosphaeris hirsuta]
MHAARPEFGRVEKSALSIAASRGQSQIAQALLKAGADINPRKCKSPLFEAIAQGDAATIHIILNAGGSLRVNRDTDGNISWCRLTDTGQVDIVKLLLESNEVEDLSHGLANAVVVYDKFPAILYASLEKKPEIDVNQWTNQKSPALLAAVTSGNEVAAWKILERNPYVNPVNQKYTPLTAALQAGYIYLAKELAKRGADAHRWSGCKRDRKYLLGPLTRDDWRRQEEIANPRNCGNPHPPFEKAVRLASREESHEAGIEMMELLQRHGVNLKDEKEDIGDFVWWPLFKESPQVLRYLARCGANPNRKIPLTDCTPVQYTAFHGNLAMLEVLVELGADINGPPGGWGGFLLYGIKSGRKDVVDFLLSKGARIEEAAEGHKSLLREAVRSRLGGEFVSVLLDGGVKANPDIQEFREVSPLAVALLAEDKAAFDLLQKCGARFRDRDCRLLLPAVSSQPIEKTRELLELGVPPGGLVDSNSELYTQPIIQATNRGRKDVIELLLKFGAQLNLNVTSKYISKNQPGFYLMDPRDGGPLGAACGMMTWIWPSSFLAEVRTQTRINNGHCISSRPGRPYHSRTYFSSMALASASCVSSMPH